jgi:integrase
MKGHLRKRGPGVWAVVVELPRDPEGRRRQKWHTVHGTKAEAERELRRILRELDTGLYADPERLLVRDYLARWLSDHAKPNCSVRTYERYQELIQSYIDPRVGHLPLAKLRPLHIQAMEADLLEGGRTRRQEGGPAGLSARTVLHVHRVLSTALRQAVRWQLLARNPAEAVRPPRPTRAPVQALDEEQTARLLAAAKGSPLHAPVLAPVLVAVMTGLRRGELLALRWSDVDLEAATLSVAQTLRVTHSGLVFAPPKTGKSRRLLALPPLVVETLREHRTRQLEERLRLGPVWEEHGLVFPGPDGRPWHPDTFTSAFRALCPRAGVKVRFHDLRHSHATQLLKAGVHPKIVSERLGHSTVGITLDIYSHLLPGMQEEAVGRLEAALRAALKENGD